MMGGADAEAMAPGSEDPLSECKSLITVNYNPHQFIIFFSFFFSVMKNLMVILPTIMKVINLNLKIKEQNKTTSYKAFRNVSSAESGSATPLFEDEDDLYDPLNSLDCSVPDIKPSSLHTDHSSVFLSPPHSDPTFLSPSDTVSVAC